MTAPADQGLPWEDAVLAAALLAVDPVGLGGILLRARAGPLRDEWLALLGGLLPRAAPVVRVPLSVTDDRLLGGLDLTATLHAGTAVLERGLLAAADGGIIVLAMAERLPARVGALVAQALDRGEVQLQRDGLVATHPTRFGFVALDEGVEPDEAPPAALADRAALWLGLDESPAGADAAAPFGPEEVLEARGRLSSVLTTEDTTGALCQLAEALGVASLRAPLAACRLARAHAALRGSDRVQDEDLLVAGRLVLAPRATRCPVPEDQVEEPSADQAPPPPPDPSEPTSDEQREEPPPGAERLVDAVAASLPPGLLQALAAGHAARRALDGRSGAPVKSSGRGRRIGTRTGTPSAAARLDIVATLRAALGFQRLRRDALPPGHPARARPVLFRREDLRVARMQARTASLIVFAVDASGSQALHRLGEAKGAVELLLAECYARRDEVALVAFRGQGAEVVLPPTRSLSRAKRSLAGLVGGGGTPLAAGLDVAAAVAQASRRKGRAPLVVLLTDGRANVARDGGPGRPRAAEDALGSARAMRAAGTQAVLVDTSPSPQPGARALAEAMGAPYVPLPHADARGLSQAVRMVATAT
jgi:magnesium chelatase subunit D